MTTTPRFAALVVAWTWLVISGVFAAEPQASPPKAATGNFGDFSLTSTKQPIHVTSDRLDFDYKHRQAIFKGTVQVTQGDIRLDSDQLVVEYADTKTNKEQQLREVTAEGNVKITQGARRATGKRAVFDQSNRTLVLTGGAALEEGPNQVTGDTIVVYPDESRMEVKGENRRVKVVLFPDKTQGGAESLLGGSPTPSPQSKSGTDSTTLLGSGE
ncbi:MAG: lipopolysaccharide export system protein LptA [Candidatus Binatota bacterium]|jgi:lipopolysaccharide export system protein LptA|nr:lipopolysaccharide export system protein LptA [Candidatus Binatota bacterium]